MAKWLTTTGVDPEDLLINELLSQQQEEIVIDNRQVEQTRIEAVKNQQIFHYLGLLKEEFPYSLAVDVLLCNMSWEYAVAWLKNIEELVVLEAATACLKYIGDVHIKRGLLTLVWNTHLRVIFEGCCKLINKAGRWVQRQRILVKMCKYRWVFQKEKLEIKVQKNHNKNGFISFKSD